MNRISKHSVDDVYKLQWIGWGVSVLVLVITAYLGVKLPALPPMPATGGPAGVGILSGFYSNFSGLNVAVPTTAATATPGVIVNNQGLGRALEVQDAGTPVWAVNDGGSVSQTGDQAITGDVAITGELQVAQATAATTATPAVIVNSSAAGSKLLEVRDASTPVFSILNGGAVSRAGNDTMTGDLNVTGAGKVAAATAVATATPALVVDSAGVSMLFEVRDSATPVVGVRDGGTFDLGVGEVTLSSTVLDLNDTYIDIDQDVENRMLPSVVSTAITYTAAAGGSGTVATIGDGEVWVVHSVFVNVTTDFDCTGDDATLVVGDGNDADGFVVLADAELQAADTEGTGFQAGWQGLVPATQGVYVDSAAGSSNYIYAPSGAAETIDYLIDESSGESLTAGAATIYVVYTRIQ